MKVEYVMPFVQASMNVMGQVLRQVPERGQLSARPQVFTSQQLSIVCGIVGDVQGQVIFGMSLASADKVASTMLGQTIVSFDQLAASAIAELGNMISGNAMTLLSQQGFKCDITPPTIIKGTNVKLSTHDIPALVIPMTSPDIGVLEITVSLKESRKAAA
ncbi:MAG: chemotaxis protein CheX [Chthonomonadaceae bacterium]|jgi:chemotaxis protein CheX|nr:chemotaxis protein CheX [Chthonomonadaceae bacterium]